MDQGFRKFIIFPFGDVGMQVKSILNNVYGIFEEYILDNHLCKYNFKIKELAICNKISCKNYCVIFACTNMEIYGDLRELLGEYFQERCIAEIPSEDTGGVYCTKIGKYSYGPICKNHIYIESIGAFCSFASGVNVQGNHEMKYITTHPMLTAGCQTEEFINYSEFKNSEWYFEGVQPKKEYIIEKFRRVQIGNDVWFGQNVLVTNYANIGNGVIAGAGTVITKDVPDYAIVVGAPARVIKYRYLPREIEQLNKIAWWDWSDEEIRERYDDFYLPIGEFIKKYGQ